MMIDSESPRPMAGVRMLVRWWPAVLAALGLVWLVSLRAAAVDRAYGAYAACQGCFDRSVWASDLRPIAVLIVIAALALWRRGPWWRGIWGSAGSAVLLLYVVDLGVFMLLGFRLRLLDLLRYGGDAYAVWTLLSPLMTEPRWAATFVATVLALGGWWSLMRAPSATWRLPALATLLSVPLMVAAHHLPNAVYVHAEGYRDFFAGMMPSGVDRPYSTAFKAAQSAQSTSAGSSCIDDGGPRRSVILVVIESLSAYQSRLHGGTMDALPRLDQLAQQGSFLETFHANGFTTDHGLIALLTGRLPLPAPGRYGSSNAYGGYEQPRPVDAYLRLHAAGFTSQFFTTGRLDFLDKGKWVRGLGFQHVEGAEHPYYRGHPRGGFDDAGDRHLYDRYLQWFDHERQAGWPHFSVLLTVSTHPPFRVPGTDIADEESAFRYADAEVTRFAQELDRRGYFDSGVLIVTGDHRSMTPLKPLERERFGDAALSRVPFVLFGASGLPQGRISQRWQQADFLPSLLAWAGLQSCTGRFQGRLAGSDPRPADVVVHVQGHHRDRLHVWRDGWDDAFELQLDGDDTSWVGDAASQPWAGDVLAEVNRLRLTLPHLRGDFIESVLRVR